MTREHIKETVERRIKEYDDSKDDWWQNWFIPTVDNIDIQTVSWEGIIAKIKEVNLSSGQVLDSFYNLCLPFNRPE